MGKVRAARARGGRRHRREARWGRGTIGRESGAAIRRPNVECFLSILVIRLI
ncbi:hypothetical protein BVI1335_530019 [Burkholderia vietnamiensis]|nr:hypothetical protein BVI1335_530019 [Burkholderia vietnamiensis]